MLVDQVKASVNCGEIESAIHRVVYLASKGVRFANFTTPSQDLIKFFINEGFKVEKFDFSQVKVSW